MKYFLTLSKEGEARKGSFHGSWYPFGIILPQDCLFFVYYAIYKISYDKMARIRTLCESLGKLDTTNKEEKQEKLIQKSFTNLDLSEYHYKFIKLLQQDIEFKSEPFKFIVDQLNISYDELFKIIQEFINSGVMRRFASILNHRKAGFSANAMVVWDIDEKKSQDIGEIAASFSAVSHCYLRPQYPNWKYNLFTMIHGKTEDDTQKTIEDIANKIEYRDKMALYSSKEFKKVRIIYFSDEFENWEKENNN